MRVGEAIVAMAEMADERALRRRQHRADKSSPVKAALVAAERQRQGLDGDR